MHEELVRTTEKEGINDKLRREYRNRIKHIYNFLKAEYPYYYAIVVRKVMYEEKTDRNLFWYKNDKNIVYSGLNIKFVKYFLAHSKIKANGKMCSNSNLCKYKDAILWGSSEANQPLPYSFYNDIENLF